MAITINNDTVVRLIVRHGTDLERAYATFAEGEPAYTIDTKRLFIGDGNTQGGVVAGNKFLGVIDLKENVQSLAQPGDFTYESATKQLWALDSAETWQNISATFPIPDSIAGVGFNYVTSASAARNIYPTSTNAIQLDSLYWSLCSSGYSNKGRFFFGDATQNSWDINNARAVFSGPIYVNGSTSQIQLSAGNDSIVKFVNSGSTTGTTTFNSASTIIFQANNSATSAAPSFIFDGDPITNGAVLVRSNLYVAGSAFFAVEPIYTHTTVTQLSVLLADTTGYPNLTALIVKNTTIPISTPATLIDVEGHYGPIITVNTSPWIGFHTNGYNTVSGYNTYNTVIAGKTLINGPLVTTNLTVENDLRVIGSVSATGDIVGFYSSDILLKDNITPITSALDKLMTVRGVEFDWNDKSNYSGHDVGVIAQDVEKVLPTAVKTRDTGYKGVQYDKIIPLIIEAIRELKDSR